MSLQRRESGFRGISGKKRGSKAKEALIDAGMNDSVMEKEQPFLDSADGLVSLNYYREMEKKFTISLKEKDTLIDTFKKDIKVVEEENAKYKDKLLGLKEKFREATKNIILVEEARAVLESKHKKLQEIHEQLQNKDESSSKQATDALKKLKHLEGVLSTERSAQDKKLEDAWKQVMARDLEIEELKENLKAARESNLNLDNNEAAAFKKILAEKNDHIKHLEDKLKDAVMEIEECTRTLLVLKSERSATNSVMTFPAINRSNGPQVKMEEKHLKSQLETLSHKLSLATERLRLFERNEYGLNEALAEIAEMKRQIRIRDMNIAELVHKVNSSAVNPEDFMKNSSMSSTELCQPKRKRRKKQVVSRINIGKQLINVALHASKCPSNYIQEEVNNKLVKWGKAVRVFRQSSRMFHKEIAQIAKQSSAESDGGKGNLMRGYISIHALEESVTQISNEVSSAMGSCQWGNKGLSERGAEGAKQSLKGHAPQRGDDEIFDEISMKSALSDNKNEPKYWENLLHKLDQYHVNERYYPGERLEDNKKLSDEGYTPRREESLMLCNKTVARQEVLQATQSRLTLLENELDSSLLGEIPADLQFVLSETLNLAKDICHVWEIVDGWNLDVNTSIHLKEYLKNFHDRLLNVYQQWGISYHHLMRTKSAPEEVTVDFDSQPSNNESNNLIALDRQPVDENVIISDVEKLGCEDDFPGEIITAVETAESEINEVQLERKWEVMENSIKNIRREKEKLQLYLQSVKLCVIQKEENIIRLNEISKQQIALLTQQLEESAPKSLFEEVTKQYNELIIKHREFIQMDNYSILNEQLIKQQQQELVILKKGKEGLEGELRNALQRIFFLEAALSKEESNGGQVQNKVLMLFEKIAELEADKKLAMEKNKSDKELHEVLKSQLLYMQENIKELHSAINSLEKQNHELQLKEVQLQDRFNNVINIGGHMNAVSVVKDWNGGVELREINVKLKEKAEIADKRAQSLQSLIYMKDAEIEQLRQQFLHIQSMNEEKNYLVRTSDDLIHAQNMISMSDDKIRFLENEVENLNSENFELKHSLLGKDVEKLNYKKIMIAYCSELLLSILEMRMRYSGAFTLLKQEKVHSNRIKLLTEFTEVKSYANKLEEALSDCIKEPIEKIFSSDTKSKVVSDERLLPCILDKVKYCEEKLKKQGEYISKLENENTLLEMQYELNKSRWENREYGLLKDLGRLISPESNTKDDGIRDIVLNELPLEVEMPVLDVHSQPVIGNDSQQMQVAIKTFEGTENWKHDAQISALKNIIKELVEQLAKAEFQINEMTTEVIEIRKELSTHVSREAEMKSIEIQNEKEHPANLSKEPPMKDFSFAYKITMEALNVILHQKDAALMRYKKQICENRVAQADTLLESKVKHATAAVEKSSEHKDLNIGGQIHYQLIQEQPKQTYKPLEPPIPKKILELQNEVSLHQRKCDYLAVQLNLWESEAHRYRTLSENKQLELEEALIRQENQHKSCSNASCSYRVETSQNDCFYGRKDMLMDSVAEEPSSRLAAIESSTPNKIMVNAGTNTDALNCAVNGDNESPTKSGETLHNKEALTLVKGNVENVDQELETLSNLINNAEEASDIRTEKELVLEPKQKPTAKLKHFAERKMNQNELKIKIEKMKVEKLEELLRNCELQLETAQSNAEKECKRKVELAKWEERKTWQKSVDKLLEKLKSEKNTVEVTKKLNCNLRDAVARLQREKTVLENKLQIFKKDKITWNPDSEMQVEALQKEILHFKKEMFDLERANISLKQRLAKREEEKRKRLNENREDKKDNTKKNKEHRGIVMMSHSMEEVLSGEKQENLKSDNDDASNKIHILEEELKSLKEENNALQDRIAVFLGKEETSSLIHNEVNALRLELARKTQLLQAVKGLLKRIHEKTKKNSAQKEN